MKNSPTYLAKLFATAAILGALAFGSLHCGKDKQTGGDGGGGGGDGGGPETGTITLSAKLVQ